MENIIQLEDNVQESFKLVKNDVSSLKDNLIDLSQNQARILNLLKELEGKEQALYLRLKQIENLKKKGNKSIIRGKKYFIASKTGKTFHEVNCPFGKNIKPRMKIIFKRKTSALNAGYKSCKCIRL